jgi:ribosome assembly protein YihI (activator of Der GTPase)
MTYNPTHDRTDWRALSTRTLIEAARDCPNELAIALGERLEELENAEAENIDLRALVDELDQRVDALMGELQAIENAMHDAQSDA